MKLIVCVLLIFALPDHCRAIEKCTGVFQENDPSNSGNGKLRPPSGTKCVEDCVFQSGRWGSSWCFTAKDKSQWGGECLDCSIFSENTSPCWSLKNGFYVTNGHGQTDECYETFTEAKLKCLAAGDCKAIATQSNICSGKFRVTHGIPAFKWWSNWKSLNLKAYEYTCPTDEQWTSETGVCVDSTGNDPQRYIEDPIDFPCSEFERTVPELGCKEFCQSDSKCKGSTFYEQHLGGYGWGCKGKCVLFSGDIDGGDGTMNSQELMMSGFKCQFRSVPRYKCYGWSTKDIQKIRQGGSTIAIQKTTCEGYANFIFSKGVGSKAPGCGGCWCCQPI